MFDKAIQKAIKAAAKHNLTAYIIPTYYGPKIIWNANQVIADRYLTVSPSGVVEMIDRLPAR
jgi:hypothetical protein